jgi:predicted nucleic acid-binding protein
MGYPFMCGTRIIVKLDPVKCDSVVPVDTALATRAFELAAKAQVRVPLVDSMIAAAAQLRDATLVHRDPHFRVIASLRRVEIGPG